MYVTVYPDLGSMPSVEAIREAWILPSNGNDTPAVSVKIGNLLPLANLSLTRPLEGVYLGEGVPPVPSKLAVRIRRGDFMEMGELLWAGPRDDEPSSSQDHSSRSHRSRKVTDIFTWLQCYGVYVSTRATAAPNLIPELMAHCASQSGLLRPGLGPL